MGSSATKEDPDDYGKAANYSIKKKIARCRVELVEKFIDARFGLVEELMAVKVLSTLDAESVYSKRTLPKQNRQIVDYALKKPLAEILKFLAALSSNGQQHVVNYLLDATGGRNTDVRPLSDEEVSRLVTNLPYLVQFSDVEKLVFHLHLHSCISEHQKEYLNTESATTVVYELVGVMQRRSFADLKKFIEILKEADHIHVAAVINEGGAVLPVRTAIARSSKTSESDGKILVVMAEIRRLLEFVHLEELRKIEEMVELKVVGVNTDSAELMLWCCTLSDLERLRDWLVGNKMKHCVESLYNRLLKTSRDSKLSVEVSATGENYARCVEYFTTKSVSRLQLKKDIYELFDQSTLIPLYRSIIPAGAVKIAAILPDVKQPDTVPLELLEFILLKTTVAMHKKVKVRLLPNPDFVALHTMFSVCREWWYVITNRKWNRRNLQREFRKPTALPLELTKVIVIFRYALKTEPRGNLEAAVLRNVAAVSRHWYRSLSTCTQDSRRKLKRLLNSSTNRPQLLGKINVSGVGIRRRLPRAVSGVTQLDDKIFIVDYYEMTIRVFDGRIPFKQLGTIKLDTESYPMDLVSCYDTKKLFVADDSGDIWRVNVKSTDNIRFIRHERSVLSISLTRRRLLVTPNDHNSLCVYDVVEGDLLQSVSLLTFMYLTHAVELSEDAFIVCHYGETQDHLGVSEVNSLGQVVRSYCGEVQLNNPDYLTLNSVGRVLVVDWEMRVVLLSKDLRSERVLLDYKQLINTTITNSWWRRMRLDYNERTNRLIVFLNYSVPTNNAAQTDEPKYCNELYVYRWK